MRIITDTASDILVSEAKDLDIDCVEIAINFEDGQLHQREEKDFEIFYEKLVASSNLPTTSQPSPRDYYDVVLKALENNEEVLIITLSKGLSGTYNCALLVKEMFDQNPLIHIVDSAQATISQRFLVLEAVKMRNQGLMVKDIVEELEQLKERIHIIASLDTLTYLKKGGRVPASIATIGNLLKIKPLIHMTEGVLHSMGQARGKKGAKQALFTEMEKANYDSRYPIFVGYTGDQQSCEEAKKFVEEIKEKFSDFAVNLYPVGGVIGTHLGPNAFIIMGVKKIG